MSFNKLSAKEKSFVLECLVAISQGNFLTGEFQTRLGISEDTLKNTISCFPEIDDTADDSPATIAINNCLNEVCHGIEFSDEEWQKWFSVERKKIVKIYRRWARLRGWKRTGIM